MLFVGVSSGFTVQAASSPEGTCTLLVRLFNEPFDDEADIPTIPLTFDAHIALGAQVEGVVDGACDFSAGDRTVFLIHSPTRTLGGYWFHDSRFYLTLSPSHTESTARQWDLAGIDWPLDNPGPYPDDVLICSNQTYVVRTLVGDSARRMSGPFSVFREGELVVSLSTIETLQSMPIREDEAFVLDYPGGQEARAFKPAFTFEARDNLGLLSMEREYADLACSWPDSE
jgi:hypothetical protein